MNIYHGPLINTLFYVMDWCKIQGSSDFSKLTEKGREQAKTLGKNLIGHLKVINGIYVSPLGRARDTLSIVRRNYEESGDNLPTEHETVLHDLREIDFYDWEGKTKNDLIGQYGRSLQAWNEGDPHNLFFLDFSSGEKVTRSPCWNCGRELIMFGKLCTRWKWKNFTTKITEELVMVH